MPYYLDNQFLLDNPWITVVGTGGTGGFVAEGLCRLFQGRDATIVLVDHDRVEPHNLLRQNFYPGEVGEFKSKALADRLARAYNRPVGYSVYPFREEARPQGSRYPGLSSHDGLIIGCADNAAARRAMAECLPGDPCRWLIDAGNDTNWGQVSGWQRRRAGGPGGTSLHRRHLPPGPGAHPATPRPADRRFHPAARRGLRGGPGPHRPGPHHQPDDGVPGVAGGPPHGGGHLPLPGPLPGHGPGDRNAVLRHPGGGGAAGGAGPTPGERRKPNLRRATTRR